MKLTLDMRATKKFLNMVLHLRGKGVESEYDSYPYSYPYGNEIILKIMKITAFSVK